MAQSQFENLNPYVFITNHLIRDLKPGAKPIVCVKPDNPKQGGWTPIPLTEDTLLPENANLYICISSCNKLFDPSSKFHGTYRASIECASQTHMFMLDDIKNLDDLPLEPTWIIETSANNYQCLYVLKDPLDDIALANQITKALPAKANADPSSKNAVRWARLPGGRNNKPEYLDDMGQGFPVRIHTANPDFLYDIGSILNAFNIDANTNNKPTGTQHTENKIQNSPETMPTGWDRYVSALSAIPADCDYDTWFKVMVALHPWGEQGYIAFEEWSKTSTNPAHKDWTEDDLVIKWTSVTHHTVSWNWLQATAQKHGWSYNTYSGEQTDELGNRLLEFTEESQLEQLYKDIYHSYLTAEDLTRISHKIQGWYRLTLDTNKTMSTIRRKIDSVGRNIDPQAETWTFPLTDEGNLFRFETLHKDHFWYIPETKQYIRWENNRWVTVNNAQKEVLETMAQIPYLEDRNLTEQEQNALHKWRGKCGNIQHIRALEQLVSRYEPMCKAISDLNTHNTIVGTPSSVLNLETGISADNSPDHLITMHTGVDVIPDATCPRWEQFIQEIMDGRQELAIFLQRLAGYCLHGGNPEQLFIILEGHGANGKTTFVNVLQHVLGQYAATAAADTLTRPAFNKSGSSAAPDIVRLYRKRLVICNEWNEGTYINESLIKVLSGGGDEIAVRALYSNQIISYTPEFVIMLATNHRPNITGMDYGIWRRLLIIPFDVNFTDSKHVEQRDPHLERYLKENESAGILNWLIEGYKQWQEKGIGTSAETGVPQCLIDIKQEYKLDMDTVGQFLQERTRNNREQDNCENYRTKSSDLHRAYRNWAEDNGYKAKGSKSFSQTLIHGGFKPVRIGTVRGFEGIRLLTPQEIIESEKI